MAGFGKMVIGQTGKKYGLHRPGQSKPKSQVGASVFGDLDDDDDKADDAIIDPAKAMMSAKHQAKMAKRQEKEMAKALAEDASIFDYDGAHDNIQKERERVAAFKTSEAGKVKAKEVRYVHALLEKTKERKREDERLFEKRLVAELKAEEEEMGQSTEKFVTAAYKAQLLANKKWEEEQKAKDAAAERKAVKKDGLTDFYASMYRGTNAATGGKATRGASPPKDPRGAPRGREHTPERNEWVEPWRAAAPQEAAAAGAEAGGGGEADGPRSLMPSAADAGLAVKTEEAAEAGAGKREEANGSNGGADAASAGAGAPGQGGEGVAAADAGGEVPGGAAEANGSNGAAEAAVGDKRKYDGWVATPLGYVREKKEITQAPTAKKDEGAVLSARERFLQRKAEKEAAAAAGKK